MQISKIIALKLQTNTEFHIFDVSKRYVYGQRHLCSFTILQNLYLKGDFNAVIYLTARPDSTGGFFITLKTQMSNLLSSTDAITYKDSLYKKSIL